MKHPKKSTWAQIYETERALGIMCLDTIIAYCKEHGGHIKLDDPVHCCEFNQGNGCPQAFWSTEISLDHQGRLEITRCYPIEDDGEPDDECDVYQYGADEYLAEDLVGICEHLHEQFGN